MRKVIVINDDFNSAKSLHAAIAGADFQVIDGFSSLRSKGTWTIQEIKNAITDSVEGKNTDEILILDIELETAPHDGVTLLKWFRNEGYSHAVIIYSGHISRLKDSEEARREMSKLGLDERLKWIPILDSQLKDIDSLLNTCDNISADDLTEAQGGHPVPWRYEYFLELTLRLTALETANINEVKNTIGLEQQDGSSIGEYEAQAALDTKEEPIFNEVKKKASQMVKMPKGANLINNNEFFKLYMSIYKSLAVLCQGQRKALLMDKGYATKKRINS